MNTQLYAGLPTEQNNLASRRIDRMSLPQALTLIQREDQSVPRAVAKERRSILKAVPLIVQSLRGGGRVFFVGAGTSGRFGVMEAAECPPTFNTPPALVQALMAGGRSSVFRSKEGAEDRGAQARREIQKKVRAGDVVIGIAASGVTPYVKDGLKAARQKKAKTILVTCSKKASLSMAHVTIAVRTGPEVISGSTRLKAGTATKLVLNSLTVLSMIQLGKVFGNWMVDLQPRSNKLRARALRLIQHLGPVSEKKAQTLLQQAKGNAKTAILMARTHIGYREAALRLKKTKGHLYQALCLN